VTESFILGTSHWISVEDGVVEFGQFSLLENEEKHSKRQAGQKSLSIVAILKVKGEEEGGERCTF